MHCPLSQLSQGGLEWDVEENKGTSMFHPMKRLDSRNETMRFMA